MTDRKYSFIPICVFSYTQTGLYFINIFFYTSLCIFIFTQTSLCNSCFCIFKVVLFPHLLREGLKKKGGKYGLLPNLPRTPPPGFGLFSGKKLTPIFFLKIASIMAETNFTLGPTSKTNKFLVLMVIICSELAGFK